MPSLPGKQPIYVPAQRAHDWRALLADPGLHWRPGYSAHALARTWQDAVGFPPAIREALDASDAEAVSGLELLLGLPEHKVALPGGSRASQTDLFVLASNSAGRLVSVAVEGKAAEPFGPTVEKWLEGASPGKLERLAFLRETLAIRDEHALPAMRYQLLHRAAAAVVEARRFGAVAALMLVHSFGSNEDSLKDYQAFARLLGATPAQDAISFAKALDGVELLLGWVNDQAPAASHVSRINTASGRELDLEHPTGEQIDVRDIASALSKVCRFGAQALDFYSVAQHAVMVQRRVVEAGHTGLALAALHHDSHEAFTCDLPSPLKTLLQPSYGAITAGLDRTIASAFQFSRPKTGSAAAKAIKDADDEILRAEAARLLPDRGRAIARARGWKPHQPSAGERWDVWPPAQAQVEFMTAHAAAAAPRA